MNHTSIRLLILTPLMLLTAACAAQKDFNRLTLGEQIDFSTCVFSGVGSKPLTPATAATPGEVLDGILGAGVNVQSATRESTLACAQRMNINPNTIPGLHQSF